LLWIKNKTQFFNVKRRNENYTCYLLQKMMKVLKKCASGVFFPNPTFLLTKSISLKNLNVYYTAIFIHTPYSNQALLKTNTWQQNWLVKFHLHTKIFFSSTACQFAQVLFQLFGGHLKQKKFNQNESREFVSRKLVMLLYTSSKYYFWRSFFCKLKKNQNLKINLDSFMTFL